MALTETWLKDHLDAELAVEGYTIFRQDCIRQKAHVRGRNYGGVALYIRDDIATSAEPVLQYSNGSVDVLGLHLRTANLMLIVLYRQPDNPASGQRSTSREFSQALDKINSTLTELPTPNPDIVLCGDFNLPHLTWTGGMMTMNTGTPAEENLMASRLQELTNEHFMYQQISGPTHRMGNTLDLFFSNNPAFIHSYQCCPTVFSDHHIIEGCTTHNSTSQKRDTFRHPHTSDGPGAAFDSLNFFSEEVDWDGLRHELDSHDWEEDFKDMGPSEMLKCFLEICTKCAVKFVPVRKSTEKKASHIPRDRRILMRRRTKVNKQLTCVTSEARRARLTAESRDIEKKLQASYRSQKADMEHKAVQSIKKNSKYFFSYARKFSKLSSGIGPLIDAANNIVVCPEKMASMLSAQYNSVFSTPKKPLENPCTMFPEENDPTGNFISNVEFSPGDLENAIGKISATAAAGPDRFPAILLKQCRQTLSKPLYLIWRTSLDTGNIPLPLKSANVVPVHKGNSRGMPKNYRPIALTSHLIKVFEKVIRAKLVEYMERFELFNPGQHGFRFGRSCLSQLLAHYDHILELLEKGYNVDVIYLDFAKAFDKVDFGVTLQKLKHLGITGKLGRWIHCFLTPRTQTVLVNDARSTPSSVKSGVPQGSVLGPLLFLMLIGDINQDVAHAFLSSFADDTRIGSKIASPQDNKTLQADLDVVYEWTLVNNMELNADKFECMRYGTNQDLKEGTQYKSNTGSTIQEQDHVKDLGVTMSNDGTFKEHIKHTITTAKDLCSWILRTFNTRDPLPLLTLWKSLVQCKLDYCCQLWSPTEKGDIQDLEMVQRTFLRKLPRLRHLSYWEQLRHLRMYSQERRRERYLIIYVWRMLEAQVPNIPQADGNSHKIQAKWHPRRGRECTIPRVETSAPHRVKKLLYASLPVRGQRLFNSLPIEVRNVTRCSVENFKCILDRYLQTVPDEPQIPGYISQRRADTNSLLDMARMAKAHSNSLVEVPMGQSPIDRGGCAPSIAVAQWCQNTQQGKV